MRYEMIIYIADKWKNKMMRNMDVSAPNKWFVETPQKVSFNTTTTVNEDYFMDLIEKSREDKDAEYWIPAISFCNTLYIAPDVEELSDGKKSMFLGKVK